MYHVSVVPPISKETRSSISCVVSCASKDRIAVLWSSGRNVNWDLELFGAHACIEGKCSSLWRMSADFVVGRTSRTTSGNGWCSVRSFLPQTRGEATRLRPEAACRASASAPGCFWSFSWHCSRGTSGRSTAGWSSIHSRVETTPSQPAHQAHPRFRDHSRSSMTPRPSHGRLQSSCPSGRSTTSRARARCCASTLVWRRRGRSGCAQCPASMPSAAALATARATASASPSAVRPACGPPAARARPAGTAPRARCATPRLATLRTAAGC